MNTVLRLNIPCSRGTTWYVPDETGTRIFNDDTYILNELTKTLAPKLEVVLDLPKANWSHPAVEAVHFETVDFIVGNITRRQHSISSCMAISSCGFQVQLE